ncbi:MAG: 4Fe-4S dicluster domain-containing protein [Syntrophobacteraceae bacterium]|jgi:heterodisulfide reductase subunit C
MFHNIALVAALAVFCAGIIIKVSTWFRYSVGPETADLRVSRRLVAALQGIFGAFFSRKILTLISTFFLEVICQSRVLKEDSLRWLAHMCIYVGFTLLFFLHVLDNQLVVHFYPQYASTLNPFLFLREAAGALVVIGVAVAIYRRFISQSHRPMTSRMDITAMIMVGAIVVSGFLLEATKITSQSGFQSMAEEYAGQTDAQELQALESYWVENFGLVAPGLRGPFDNATLVKGKASHEMNCAQCHSSARWGFVGYALSVPIRPVASALDGAQFAFYLTWAHYLISLFFLAYLPFSKMFHIVTTPLSLMVNSVMDGGGAPANVATRQMLELDACTHCGACTLRCSVAVTFLEYPNANILPSEKIASLKKLAAGKVLDRKELRAIQQGIVLCTNCDRCGGVCPAGIKLRDLWFSARERLLQYSIEEFQLLSPLAYYRGLQRDNIQEKDYLKPLDLAFKKVAGDPNGKGPLTAGDKTILGKLSASIQANSLSNCYRCSTCTSFCPVVQNYKRPAEVLGLLPHELMHAVGLRCWDLVFSSRMLWDCLGCYQCQENCPQCVSVTDILYELKNRAISRRYDELTA